MTMTDPLIIEQHILINSVMYWRYMAKVHHESVNMPAMMEDVLTIAGHLGWVAMFSELGFSFTRGNINFSVSMNGILGNDAT